jgi:hypothetical protein
MSPHPWRSHAACRVWVAMLANALTAALLTVPLVGARAGEPAMPGDSSSAVHPSGIATFQTSDRCLACHNGLTSAAGEDVSIGKDWRTTLMANSSRDPYWQASVRRETQEHAASAQFVEDDCSACHMPVARYKAKQAGHPVGVFDHLPMRAGVDREASDGVTCSVCHQIRPDNLGTEDSYNGQFIIAGAEPNGTHPEFGPFDIDLGLMQVMRSSSDGYQPVRGDHMRSSELCASCHTLKTNALGPDGRVTGTLPEQMPYQEWLHSDYRQQRSCQSCHMPAVAGAAPISRVLGQERQGVARHEFVAANFVIQRLFGRHSQELGAVAPAEEYLAAADRTERYLQSSAARLHLTPPQLVAGRLQTDIEVDNLGGHKLPTAFPARRAWLHIVVRDGRGEPIFESGALRADGSIAGNTNDEDATRFAPHLREIRDPGQVQIYEAILGDANRKVTTGLLAAVDYLKDNRLLPHGFDKATADPQVAVHGDARDDPGFTGQGHRLRLSVDVSGARGPLTVEVELKYQPIGYRWAQNLKAFPSPETARFNNLFASQGVGAATTVVRAEARFGQPAAPLASHGAPFGSGH